MGETVPAKQIYKYIGGKIRRLDEGTPWAKALLAKLRRGLGKSPDLTPEIWELTLGSMPETLSRKDGKPSYAEWAIHTALTLYALHKQGNENSLCEENGANFGGGVVRLVNEKTAAGILRRFDAMITAQDLTELSHHARGLIQLMRTADVPIKLDYASLAADLYYYQFPDGRSRALFKWGQDFHRDFEKYKMRRENQNE